MNRQGQTEERKTGAEKTIQHAFHPRQSSISRFSGGSVYGPVFLPYASTSASRAFYFVPSGAPNRCLRLLEIVSNVLRRLQLLLDNLHIIFV